jgi:pimeloyl-ACP methyl ester carboxylesterase
VRRLIGSVVTTLTMALVLTEATVVAEAADNPFDLYNHQQLTWGPCLFTADEDALPAECTLVTVPRDWAHPDAGVDLKVSVSRVKATGKRTGVILVNPGGPGGQGTSLAGVLAALQPAVSQQYDFIGMDPRGTGQEGGTAPDQRGLVCSVPNGRLSTRTDLDARDRSAQSIAEHQKAPRAIAEACQSDALTPYITTWQTAHDMELIRQLLGESTLNYLGYSYGTWLGAKYTSLFPASAGKVVLDSSVDWQGRLQADFEDFPVIDQRQFDEVYLPWMSRQFPDLVGTTPAAARQTWEQVRAFFKANGLAADSYDGIFVGMGNSTHWLLATLVFALGAGEVHGGAPASAASPDVRAALDAESKAKYGVPAAQLTVQKIAAAAQPDYTLVGGTRFAVACGDQPTKSAAWYRALSDRQGPRYPLFGWAYGLSEACGFWSDAPQQTLPDLPAQAAGKVLVIQGEFDPQTGYEQARSAVRAAPGVSMVSVDDAAFHGQYALEGNPCVDGMVNVFLLKNSRPASATCPGVPLPGETAVYPVAGPVKVKQQQSQAAAQVQPLPRLRAKLQAKISEINSGNPS